jgi:hypothetical protein
MRINSDLIREDFGWIARSSLFNPSRPTWGIASLRQTTYFFPQDIFLREHVEKISVLPLAGMMTLPTQ